MTKICKVVGDKIVRQNDNMELGYITYREEHGWVIKLYANCGLGEQSLTNVLEEIKRRNNKDKIEVDEENNLFGYSRTTGVKTNIGYIEEGNTVVLKQFSYSAAELRNIAEILEKQD